MVQIVINIDTQVLPNNNEFVDKLCSALQLLKPHAYISNEQALYFKILKESMEEGIVIVQCDFSENYSFVIQDSPQIIPLEQQRSHSLDICLLLV